MGNKIFHPSRQTRLHQRYSSLTREQRGIVADIVDKRLQVDGPQMRQMPLPQQHAVIDTLLDYHQFTKDTKQTQGKSLSPEYVAALSARLRLPPGESAILENRGPAPDTGNAPSWVQLGLAQRRHGSLTQILRIRPAYYDALDVSGAQAKHGGLSMGDLQVEVDGPRLRIMHFDLIAIDSMNPAVTGLPGDRGAGWKLRAGLEQERIGCRNCLAARIQGDYSLGSMIGPSDVLGAIHVGGAVQGHAEFDGIGFARLGASVVMRPTDQFGLRAAHEIRRSLDPRYAPYAVSSAEARVVLMKDFDFRVKWERDMQSRVSLAIGHYW